MDENCIHPGLLLPLACHQAAPAPSSVPIAIVLKDPRSFEGRSIILAGPVTSRQSMLSLRYFSLRDRTGEIRVVTPRTLPALGEQTSIHGTVQQAFAFGDRQLVVFREDDPAQAYVDSPTLARQHMDSRRTPA